MNDAIRRLVCTAALLAAAGCASRAIAPPPDQPEAPQAALERREKAARPTYNLTGYPAAVREGYIDGCETAKASEYARKDAQRFAADPQYAMGWNDGLGICGTKR
jgi:hypothetical protein